MFDLTEGEFVNNRLWAIAACIAAAALVMRQIANAVSWYVQGTRKVVETDKQTHWG